MTAISTPLGSMIARCSVTHCYEPATKVIQVPLCEKHFALAKAKQAAREKP